jgi:hypothetical protein
MADVDLPPHLIAEIEAGNVVLMLGAGASLGSINSKGQRPPNAFQLGKAIAERFLPAGYDSKPLNQIAEYAISETDLFTVQSFIWDVFEAFTPTPSHITMASFRWRGIATTNYDTLVEQAYHNNSKAPQHIAPFINNWSFAKSRSIL